MELDAIKRISDARMLARMFRGIEHVARGPIIAYCDCSGSMSGTRIQQAKALCLTLGNVAKWQKRWCAFVGFCDGPEGDAIWFPPNKWDEATMIEWLVRFQGGGTDLCNLCNTLPDEYWPKMGCPRGKTDIIVITDAGLTLEKKDEAKFKKFKEEQQVKAYGLILGHDRGDLARICDQSWLLSDLSLDAEAIEAVLSI